MTNPVKWIGADGGWKVGHLACVDGYTPWRTTPGALTIDYLVQHQHTRELDWVTENTYEPYVVTPEFK
jgi:hypothetical protein